MPNKKSDLVIDYGLWEIDPGIIKSQLPKKAEGFAEMKSMDTMYEGTVTYLRYWNFWVRAGTPVTAPIPYYFTNYESSASDVQNMISAIGTSTAWPHTQEEVWSRISTVWNWLGNNARIDNAAYNSLNSGTERWPSIEEFAQYYAVHHEVVWWACFSKAHLFAILLGRVLPRWHTIIATGHHTEGDAPPTASHVYVGVYLTDRWYYLDPAAVYSESLDSFENRKSVGIFTSVDYEHPFSAIPVPLSPLDTVPCLAV